MMRSLAAECPATDGRAAFELAGMYDSMGYEAEAGDAYEQSLRLGLDEARHAQLAVQYGSTLRNLGVWTKQSASWNLLLCMSPPVLHPVSTACLATSVRCAGTPLN